MAEFWRALRTLKTLPVEQPADAAGADVAMDAPAPKSAPEIVTGASQTPLLFWRSCGSLSKHTI